MKLSENLKRIRKENNLSQEQLAEQLGVSRQSVSKWESGQSYPEMDKVLLICKLYNFNMDELMNENVKEVNETKQAKININKYVDDFFAFITKTVEMFSSMTFKQKLKCIIEQFLVIIVLGLGFLIIADVGSLAIFGILGSLPPEIYRFARNILQSVYIILGIIMAVTIFLHIFKIRYLDYYEIVKEEDLSENDKSEDQNKEKNTQGLEKQKIFLEKKKEKIIIRDPEHSQSRFLSGIIRMVLWFVKFIVAWIGLGFAVSLVCFVVLLVLSFLFVKTGLLFLGALLGLLAAISIHLVILELIYNFIMSKKSKKARMGISFVVALIVGGISIGMMVIGSTKFNIVKDTNLNNDIEEVFEVPMTENLVIEHYRNIEYIESDLPNVKIVVKHSKLHDVRMIQEGEIVDLYFMQDDTKIMEIIRDVIEDINRKEIRNYYEPIIEVHASKENIEKMKQNIITRKENSQQELIDELNVKINELEIENLDLENKIHEKNILLEEQDVQLQQMQNEIEMQEE